MKKKKTSASPKNKPVNRVSSLQDVQPLQRLLADFDFRYGMLHGVISVSLSSKNKRRVNVSHAHTCAHQRASESCSQQRCLIDALRFHNMDVFIDKLWSRPIMFSTVQKKTRSIAIKHRVSSRQLLKRCDAASLALALTIRKYLLAHGRVCTVTQ